MNHEREAGGRQGEPTSEQGGRPDQTKSPREAGERADRIDRRQFLKGAVEMAAGGLLIFESASHLAEGVATLTMQKKAKEGSSKLDYGLDVVKAGIGSCLIYIGFD